MAHDKYRSHLLAFEADDYYASGKYVTCLLQVFVIPKLEECVEAACFVFPCSTVDLNKGMSLIFRLTS
jgi:hypothetical protein